ncbi:MAG: trypsin-like serine protease [Bdellovibrionaceae bacterium]|jgi:V8-like Glu-specific endopeptidase|nr:trypsin-like serine protease [Pseudobdellovibrionaceae bacterium]
MQRLNRFIIIYLYFIITVSCSTENEISQRKSEPQKNTKVEAKVVYGDDNRIDLYEVTKQKHLELADSTVALINPLDVEEKASYYKLNIIPYGKGNGLCKSEPFYSQSTLAFCSGFFVGKNRIVTAGHCIQTQFDCDNTKLVFGFGVKKKGVVPDRVAKSEVYSCKKLIKHNLNATGSDYSVIELDRDVEGHKALRLRRSGTLAANDELLVIGHPVGLPTKVAEDAHVRRLENGYFVANLDTYGGNSGSAVFNAKTFEVEGILVRGETDYTFSGNCRKSKKCKNSGCRGEDATLIAEVLSEIPELVDEEPVEELVSVSYASDKIIRIPDSPFAGIESHIQVLQAPQGRAISVTVDITHSWRGDLVVKLKSPSGKSVVLQNRKGRNQDDIKGEFGVDLLSQDSLEVLSAESQEGQWSLSIADKARFDKGQLNSWSLNFSK